MSAAHTPGPWSVCQHLKSVEDDAACRCGYRGVIYGPEHHVAMAICQPGHQPAPEGQEGTEPSRYPREVEIANARLIAACPELLENALCARDTMSRAADIFESMGRADEAARLRRGADICRAAIAKATEPTPC